MSFSKSDSLIERSRRLLVGSLSRLQKRLVYIRKGVSYLKKPNAYFTRCKAIATLPQLENLNSYITELHFSGFTLADNLVDGELLSNLNLVVEEKIRLAEGAQVGERKSFWKNIVRPEERSSENILVKFALQERVLSLISCYLRQVPYLADLELVVSHAAANEKWKISQLWHKDYNDSRMVKLFTYFSDVESLNDGPFTFIPANHSGKLKNKRWPTHKTDEEMTSLGGTEHAIHVLGPKLTSFLIDTSRCYHMGSRTEPGRTRVALIATYTTYANFGNYDNQIRVENTGSSLHRMVLRA